MNQRIRELAEQVYGTCATEQEEKFAELIVRECAELFEIEYGESELTGNDVVYVVKKHFRVK